MPSTLTEHGTVGCGDTTYLSIILHSGSRGRRIATNSRPVSQVYIVSSKPANDCQTTQEKKEKERRKGREGGRCETIQTAQDALPPVISQTRGHDGIMLGQTGHVQDKHHMIYIICIGYLEQSRPTRALPPPSLT